MKRQRGLLPWGIAVLVHVVGFTIAYVGRLDFTPPPPQMVQLLPEPESPPFAGVHPTIKDTVMETILRVNREEAVTFLIVSHEMATLRRLCPRVSVMHEGRLIAEGSFEEIANHAAVLEAYLGR